MATRKEIEDRILHIISHINSKQMLNPLYWNLKLFSSEELLPLLDFLETWNYSPIYILLDKKRKEYLAIGKQIRQIHIWDKMNILKDKEKKEKQSENEKIEKMLIF
jgi:hypothetical protein